MGKGKSSVNNIPTTDQEAIEWMARHLSGAMAPEETHRFEEWLTKPGRRQAYERVTQSAAAADPFGDDLLAESFEAELAEFAEENRPRRWVTPAISAIAATIVASVAAGFVLMNSPVGPETVRYATFVGERETVPLEDGSTITLNTATQLEVTYDLQERHVTMAGGEAFFNVAREPGRVFSVVTEHGDITVTGTSFNVHKTSELTSVSVISGAVDVHPAGRELITLLAGEAITFGPEITPLAKNEFDATRVLSWRTGRVIFEDTPLSEVTAELNRYFRVPIVLTADAPANAPVTGEFDITDPATVVRGLSVAMALEASRGPERILLGPSQAEE